jgi:hypothetical protein
VSEKERDRDRDCAKFETFVSFILHTQNYFSLSLKHFLKNKNVYRSLSLYLFLDEKNNNNKNILDCK